MRNAPMFLTAGNALLGVFALYLILINQMEPVIYVILIGAVLDGIDGWAARRMGVASPLGASADMISDMISFGIVPALMVARVAGTNLGIIAGALYLMAIAFRLIRFRFGQGIERGFVGMPSPATALIVIALATLASRNESAILLAGGGSILASLLAVSKIIFPKWGHPALMQLPKPVWVGIYIVHFVLLFFRPAEAVLSIMLIYLFLGPVLMHRYRLKYGELNRAGVS